MRLTFQIAVPRGVVAAGGMVFSLLAIAGLAVVTAHPLWPGSEPVSWALSGARPALPVPPLPPPWPLSIAAHAARTIEGEFASGTTFAGVLMDAGVPAPLVDAIADAARPEFDPRQIRAGRAYKVYFDAADELILFRYQPDRQTAVLVARGAEGWTVKRRIIPYELRPRYLHAAIRGSLEGAIADTWVSHRDAIDLARKLAAVFAWDIDFAADLRLGDTVDVVVEQRFLEDEVAGFGDVLAAELRVDGRPYAAVRYARGNSSLTYFTPSGESLQRSFLRSPVQYTRISSGFTYRRMHPILNVVRPHLGVDYVAPAGTAVHATAAGTVIYVGRNSQAGNHVRIRHGGSYISWYLHLSAPAAGLRVGQQVEQGQVIGYVGKTGLATSPHLDYRLERDGQFLDPLKIDFPAAAPLPAAQMAEFATLRDHWLSLLHAGQRQSQQPLLLAGSSE